ncbi:unnamed protein product [Mytilus coruscus]|uniref:C2H2-type domain-containing protein n=1 Tax=Mytilus coruscus TaxID=42192 RepID=A0A6J8DVK1_MYTCO|nr:unnamed protein product [Mytilus coruscus]
MKNPCSYTSVKHVLTRIIETTCASRQWSIAGCDGSPYILGSRLMDKSFNCKHCNTDYTNKYAFQKHVKESHDECDINESRTFGKLLLVPGLGHIEINMAKGCFKLLWHVFLKELGNMLGFRTIRAQTCCQMATDHHKAMQMIEIALFGFADELIFKFCEFCKLNKVSPSVQEYFTWFADVKNENFIFTSEVTFTYLLSLYLFRAAVRRNNSSLILASRMKFAPLFYSLNMTN